MLDKQNWSQETLAEMMKKMHRSAISRYACENLRK
ncbi:helix-turn-helix domain-containing protein [Neobacillus cucumis]